MTESKNVFECDLCKTKIEERSHEEILGECSLCGGILKVITNYRPKTENEETKTREEE